MKLRSIEIDSFGVWRGLELGELSQQLNVFHGPNEAGKSTLLDFVRSVLFGYSPERRARYLPPLRGGRPGGALGIVRQGSPYKVARHADGAEPGLEIVAPAGVRQDAALLGDMLGAVDESVFCGVFACGLREMQEFGSLSATAAASLLYDLSLGMEGLALAEVMRELAASRARLLADDGGPSRIAQLFAERQRIKGQIEPLANHADQYWQAHTARREVAEETRRDQQRRDELEEKRQRLLTGQVLEAKWKERAAIEQQLASLADVSAIPDEVLPRIERIGARVAASRARRAKLSHERRSLRAEAASLPARDPLRRRAARLEGLAEQATWIAALSEQIVALQDEVAALELDRESRRAKWGSVPAQGVARSAQAWSNLRTAAKAATAARAALRRLEPVKPAEKTADPGAASKVEQALARRGAESLDQALDRAGAQAALLRRRVHLDERIVNLSRRREELEEQTKTWFDKQQLSTWTLASLGSVFVLGFALLVGGLLLPATLTGGWAWPLVFLGAGGAATAAFAKAYLERSAAEGLAACQQQGRQATDQLRQCERDRDEIDAELPQGGGPLVVRLKAAERELAELEALLPIQGQIDQSKRQESDLAGQVREARLAWRGARQRWQRALAAAGLPANLKPRQVAEMYRARNHSSELDQSLATAREQLRERREKYDALSARINQLAAETGTSAIADPLATLRHMLDELRTAQQNHKRRGVVLRKAKRVGQRRARVSRAIRRLVQRHRQLLEQAGALDEGDLRRRVELYAQYQELDRRRRTLTAELETALSDSAGGPWLREQLEAGRDLAELIRDLDGERAAVDTRLAQLNQRHGEFTERLGQLAADRQLFQLRLSLDATETQLRQAVERWQVLALAQLVLEAVRDFYERDRQPETLREASLYLQSLTGGRYVRVWARLGEQELRVDDETGHALPAAVLSQGTREQLFLALRLALVSAYARRGVRLPLILDDVLVNCDAERSKAAVKLLADFARVGHQVLYFTCHEHIVKLMRSQKAEVRRLPDNTLTDQSAAADVDAARELAEPVEPEPVLPPQEPRRTRAKRRFHTPHIVTQQEPIAPSIAPSPEPASTAPLPAPSRAIVHRAVDSTAWDAEEFSGELTDRVARQVTPIDERQANGERPRRRARPAAEPDEPSDAELPPWYETALAAADDDQAA